MKTKKIDQFYWFQVGVCGLIVLLLVMVTFMAGDVTWRCFLRPSIDSVGSFMKNVRWFYKTIDRKRQEDESRTVIGLYIPSEWPQEPGKWEVILSSPTTFPKPAEI